ncbi:pyridoxal phosphate-dependent aminotransferase [Candidatus Acetothermia bacterium]|nr:pyridoxal phosphate-dependent aminotransferase [Candidatus Acetothermia bacterium]MBI3644103.1 pyridoxal phosphate-dependent aminotransferase [Candidatus Acetothermia bacterium]
MSVRRLEGIPGFSIDRVAAAAGSDPEILRMENLDTDLLPPQSAIKATRAAIGRDDDNSYLPFTGTLDLRSAVSEHLKKLTKLEYDPNSQIVITCGGTEGMFDALLATTDPGDEVVLTDPTYAGMIYRVQLAGAVPRLVPFVIRENQWRLDLNALRASINKRTRALFIMNPSMPSGAVLNQTEWKAIADICQHNSFWLIYNAAMERILFDQRTLIHPASLDGMAERTIIVGSVSKEYRMIGWRVGWVAGPKEIMADIAKVHIYNVVAPTGISQAGAAAALRDSNNGVTEAVNIWEQRRDVLLEQLHNYSVIPAAGGWSLLLNVKEIGLTSFEASKSLLEKGKIAATPMRDWGKVNSDQFVRLVFSNEPAKRLADLKARFTRVF